MLIDGGAQISFAAKKSPWAREKLGQFRKCALIIKKSPEAREKWRNFREYALNY